MRRRTSACRSTTSKPATLARPALGCSSVHSIEMVVDLPAPFGPRNPKVWPGGTEKLTPRTASSSSNRLTRPSAWMAAAPCLEPLLIRISGSVVRRHQRVQLALHLAVALPPGVQVLEELDEAGHLGLDAGAKSGVVPHRLGQDLGAALRRPAGQPLGAKRRQPVLDADDLQDLVEIETHHLLQLADVLQARDVVVGVAPRAAWRASGGVQQAELLVVAQRAAGDAHAGGRLADPELAGALGHADIDSSASDNIVDSSCS